MTRARIYERGSEPTSADRHRMARERFKAAGGGRKTIAFTAEALQALARLQRRYRLPNATATINWILITAAADFGRHATVKSKSESAQRASSEVIVRDRPNATDPGQT